MTWAFFLSTAPVLFFMAMQASSFNTALGIIRKKSVGELSCFPFLSMTVNGAVWTLYATLKQDATIFIPNFSSLIVGFICTVIYNSYTKLGIPAHYFYISSVILCLCIILAAFENASFIGIIGVAMAVILMGSPLAVIKTVLDTRSTAALPFYTSLMTFFNAFSWSLYGILIAHDVMVWFPNLLGLCLTIGQLALFVLFGVHTQPTDSDVDSRYDAVSKVDDISNLEILPISGIREVRYTSVHQQNFKHDETPAAITIK